MFLELEQRGGIVHQHVGVQHVDALASGHWVFQVMEQGEPSRLQLQGDGGHGKPAVSLFGVRLYCGQHGLGMAGHLDLAPFLHDMPIGR